MSEKRFNTNGYYINDTFYDGRKWLVNEVEAKEIVDEMNNLDTKARERSKALSKLQNKYDEQQAIIQSLEEEIKLLKPTNIEQYEQIVQLQKENEQLRKQIQNYEQLISNSYVGEEETLDGFVGKYVIWENELQRYRKKNKNELIKDE